MISWTIRTLDRVDNKNQPFDSNWIYKHIHDSTQILDVICENNNLISSSVIINGRLRNLDLIIYSLMRQKKTSDDIVDFVVAYDEWYELYKIPILADSEPIVLSDVSVVQYEKPKKQTTIYKIKNLFSYYNTKKAKPIPSPYYTETNSVMN